MSCPTNALSSFPVERSVTATELGYESVTEPVAMDFQWAPRSTEPSYLNKEGADAIIDEVGGGNTSRSTLRYRGVTYTINSVQLTNATHKSWIAPQSAATSNTADMILTFSTTTDAIQYKYIVIVIPLLFGSDIVPTPNYIRGLATSYAKTEGNPTGAPPYSLESIMPTDKHAMFAYYSTCLKGYVDQKTPEKVYVFISVTGVPVSTTIMNQIKSGRGQVAFPNYDPPFMSRLEKLNKLQQVDTTAFPFASYVQTTSDLLNAQAIQASFKDVSLATREDTLDSYKCVPLDPDRNIEEGKIQVDVESGELLSDVIKERDAVRAADQVKGGMEPGRLEKYMGSVLGIVMAIIFFGSILYLGFSWFMDARSSSSVVPLNPTGIAAAAAGGESWVQKISLYGLMTLIAGFIGFIIGAMLS